MRNDTIFLQAGKQFVGADDLAVVIGQVDQQIHHLGLQADMPVTLDDPVKIRVYQPIAKLENTAAFHVFVFLNSIKV